MRHSHVMHSREHVHVVEHTACMRGGGTDLCDVVHGIVGSSFFGLARIEEDCCRSHSGLVGRQSRLQVYIRKLV